MGATVHPHSLTARGSAAAVRRACASSSIRINPACVAKPAAAVAKKPKRPASFHEGSPPAKRARGSCGELEPDTVTKIKRCPRPSSDEDRCPAGPLRKGVEALCVAKNQAAPEDPAAPPKPPVCSMRQLLERARLAKARTGAADSEADPRREIELRRAEARRAMEQVVRTVEFNDPFIDPQDVLK